MDPLSIASSAAAVAGVCLKVTSAIYTFVDESRGIDANVNDLLQEILGLSNVLEAISQSWTKDPLIVSAQAHSHGNLWGSVRSSLDDCNNTLEKLDKKLDDVQKSSRIGRGFLRKPTKLIKLNMNMKEILAYKQRVSWHNSAMQSAFQLINVCLALRNNSTQESVAQVLSSLKSQIGRVEYAVQGRYAGFGSGGLDDDEKVSHNLEELAKAAESFHSNVSTIMGDGARSTVWGGSIMGDPLSEDQYANISDWIPPPTINEETEPKPGHSRGGSSSANALTLVESSGDSDGDSDFESHFTKRFEELAVNSLSQKEYSKAETFLKKVLDRRNNEKQSAAQITSTSLTLAFVYGAQGKYEDAGELLMPIATAKRRPTNEVIFLGLYQLAQVSLEKLDHNTAIQYCKRAAWGYDKISGKTTTGYLQSIALLVQIYRSNGDNSDAEVYESFLPDGFQLHTRPNPSEYCRTVFAESLEKGANLDETSTPGGLLSVSSGSLAATSRETLVNSRPHTASNSASPSPRPTEIQRAEIPISPPMSQQDDNRALSMAQGRFTKNDSQSNRPNILPLVQSTKSDPQSIKVQATSGRKTPQPGWEWKDPSQSRHGRYSSHGEPSRLAPENQSYPKANVYSYSRSVIKPNAQTWVQQPPPPLLNASIPWSGATSHAAANGVRPVVAQVSLNQMPSQTTTIKPVLSQSRKKAQLVIGIDFGTKYTAVAFAFATSTAAKEDIITEWPGAGSYTKQQIPSVLYYDSYGLVVGWGPDISNALAPTGYPKPGVQKLEWFKHHLWNNGILAEMLPPLPPSKTNIDVVADYLVQVRRAVRVRLQKTLGQVFDKEESNIHYCFTVPIFWNERAQTQFRAAIVQAGFIKYTEYERLSFIPEPLAIISFCNKTGLMDLHEKDVVLLVDCTAETSEVSSYMVNPSVPFGFTEYSTPIGDSCGSTALNRNFNNILRARIRKMGLPEGSKTAGRVYAKCIMDFEHRIKGDFRNTGQKWAVDVGIEAEFPEAGIEEGYMTFLNEDILACFKPVVDRIVEMAKDHGRQVIDKGGRMKIALVSGELGVSEYVFQVLKASLSLVVVRPMDSEAAKVKGAVTVGILETYAPKSIAAVPPITAQGPVYQEDNTTAQRSWLIEKPQLYLPGVHPESERCWWIDGKDRCRGTTQIILPKGYLSTGKDSFKISMEKVLVPGKSLLLVDVVYTSSLDYFRTVPWGVNSSGLVTDSGADAATYANNMLLSNDLLGWEFFAHVHTNLTDKNLDRDFRKFRLPQGTFYLIEYELEFTFGVSALFQAPTQPGGLKMVKVESKLSGKPTYFPCTWGTKPDTEGAINGYF